MASRIDQTHEENSPITLRQKLSLIGEILRVYVRVRIVLWRRPLPRGVEELRARARSQRGLALVDENPWRLAQTVVRVLALLPTDARCLVRSMVLLTLLERRSVSGTLVIGVKVAPSFGAHAWVERDGRVLLPAGAEYQRLTEL